MGSYDCNYCYYSAYCAGKNCDEEFMSRDGMSSSRCCFTSLRYCQVCWEKAVDPPLFSIDLQNKIQYQMTDEGELSSDVCDEIRDAKPLITECIHCNNDITSVSYHERQRMEMEEEEKAAKAAKAAKAKERRLAKKADA